MQTSNKQECNPKSFFRGEKLVGIQSFLSTKLKAKELSLLCLTHSVTLIDVGSLIFLGDNHLDVAGSILTDGK